MVKIHEPVALSLGSATEGDPGARADVAGADTWPWSPCFSAGSRRLPPSLWAPSPHPMPREISPRPSPLRGPSWRKRVSMGKGTEHVEGTVTEAARNKAGRVWSYSVPKYKGSLYCAQHCVAPGSPAPTWAPWNQQAQHWPLAQAPVPAQGRHDPIPQAPMLTTLDHVTHLLRDLSQPPSILSSQPLSHALRGVSLSFGGPVPSPALTPACLPGSENLRIRCVKRQDTGSCSPRRCRSIQHSPWGK